MTQGKFFVLDGVDGSGKGEQLRRLQRDLPAFYPDREFVFTREPGGTGVYYAEAIRKMILEHPHAKDASGAVMIQLFGAARFEHLEKLVLPALKLGKVVISDRFDGSTFAYQLTAQCAGIDARELFDVQRKIIHKDLPAWKTIILDVDAKVAMARSSGREGQERTHFDDRKAAFHTAVQLGFQAYARDFPSSGAVVVDASRSIEEVYVDVLAVFKKELG